MYRTGEEYDKMAEIVGQIYIDYDIREFPINEKDVCSRMGIHLVPYSEYPEEKRALLKKKSYSGFYVPPTSTSPPMIFYNDNIDEVGSIGNMRRNIFHEVRHYVFEDNNECSEEDLADYFGKYFLAPISYLIALRISNVNQIIADFGVDFEMASFIAKNLRNRRNRYDNRVFKYEKPLLHHLLGDQYELFIEKHEGSDVD